MTASHTPSALLIDDDRMTREIVASLLQSEGFEVDAVDGGTQALQLLEHQDYDLLITDLRMRGMDGLELLRIVRDSHTEMAPVVISGHDELIKEAQAQGYCAETITKPFHLEELMSAIQRSLNEQWAGGHDRG